MAASTNVRGTLAAALTPLTGAGGTIDEDGIAAVTEFYVRAGLDGILALGTTGEGILFSVEERRQAADAFVAAAHNRFAVVVHCGAQTTHDTVVLAEHAASVGAAGVAVIPPPYFPLDADAIWRHLDAAAGACAPTPFYVYEFAARSGYAVPIEVIERLRSTAPNLAGMKVSDSTFDAVRPYLIDGLDVFIGAEGLIAQGLELGAAGSVSGLASALPEVTINAVTAGTQEASELAARIRTSLEVAPFHAAMKCILQHRGVAIDDAVRAPLLAVDEAQRQALHRLIDDPSGEIASMLEEATAAH
ncbi:MAG TPA: dihydrodipicolinate synthase family protein [Candidatus Saccharimonadales bacterium]|nr:dihydrodipicolinate synthase family protein [Candidatus Saccharimonadales bacterium]